jgi:cytoskeletal protein CcmA (bactofilin family)
MWRLNPKHEKKPVESFKPDTTYIGKSIAIRGELSGGGNVRIAGEMEGPVELRGGSLTVEPAGRVRGDVEARSIVVQGRVEGNLFGTKSVELKASAVLVGDVQTPRIAKEEGASLTGNVHVQTDTPTHQIRRAG